MSMMVMSFTCQLHGLFGLKVYVQGLGSRHQLSQLASFFRYGVLRLGLGTVSSWVLQLGLEGFNHPSSNPDSPIPLN